MLLLSWKGDHFGLKITLPKQSVIRIIEFKVKEVLMTLISEADAYSSHLRLEVSIFVDCAI